MRAGTYRNIGQAERLVRVTIGIVLIGIAVLVPGAWWGYLGIIPVITGLVGWCPLYTVVAAVRGRKTAP
jgi:hypothetical protein